MPAAVKLGINCLVAAALTLAGILLFARLPRITLEPLQWAGRHFDQPTAMAFWFVYTASLWAVLGAVIAWGMMFLEPRKAALYGCASAVTFIVTLQSWSLAQSGNAWALAHEFVFVFTIPTLYWVFVRLRRRGRNT
jgi:uncharacterized membrane protein